MTGNTVLGSNLLDVLSTHMSRNGAVHSLGQFLLSWVNFCCDLACQVFPSHWQVQAHVADTSLPSIELGIKSTIWPIWAIKIG